MKRFARIRWSLLVIILLMAFLLPSSARADDGLVYGETVPAGAVVNHDVILIGQNVSLQGTVNGNVFILGNQVVVDGVVNGSLVMIAQNAAIGGTVSGAVYAAALTLNLPGTAVLKRDLYAATVSLTSQPASQVGRQLFALGLDAGLNGKIGGPLHTAIGPIQLYNGLMRLLGFNELTIELHFEIPQKAPAPAPSLTPTPTPAPSTQGSLAPVRFRLHLQDPPPAFDWSNWGLALLRGWAAIFAFGLLMLWLTPRPLSATGAPLRTGPWRTLGLGLIVLVVSLNLFLVGLLLAALVFALGLGLNALGLWQISLALWALAYAALVAALTGLALFIAYCTKALVSFHLAAWLFERFALPKAFWMDVLALLLGTVVFALLRSIPYVGWAIGLLVTSAGMGAAWLAWRGRNIMVEEVKAGKAAKR